MAKDKSNKDLTIEFANQTPTVDDIPDFEIRLFSRCLVEAYKKYRNNVETSIIEPNNGLDEV